MRSGAKPRSHAASARPRHAASKGSHSNRAAHSLAPVRSRRTVIGRRVAVGAVVGSLFLLAGPGVTLAEGPKANSPLPSLATPLTGQQLGGCIAALTTLVTANLSDVASGIPDQNVFMVNQAQASFASDPSGWTHVQAALMQVMGTATADFLGLYNRDVHAEVGAYHQKIIAACQA